MGVWKRIKAARLGRSHRISSDVEAARIRERAEAFTRVDKGLRRLQVARGAEFATAQNAAVRLARRTEQFREVLTEPEFGEQPVLIGPRTLSESFQAMHAALDAIEKATRAWLVADRASAEQATDNAVELWTEATEDFSIDDFAKWGREPNREEAE